MTQDMFVFFYHEYDENGCFSNWYPAEFDYAGKHYHNSEQYMMYQKVAMFKRFDIAQQILNITDPQTVKNLGRQNIPEFKQDVWEATCRHVMRRGLRAKFLQNPDLLRQLLDTENRILAEASPTDKKWGIGLSMSDPARYDVEAWTGRNYLGVTLMEIRNSLKHEIQEFGIDRLTYYDTRNAEPNSVWNCRAGELMCNPIYYSAIRTYSDTLPTQQAKDTFYFLCSLNNWDWDMKTNMGGGLPIGGFYEMKQEIYEIASLT